MLPSAIAGTTLAPHEFQTVRSGADGDAARDGETGAVGVSGRYEAVVGPLLGRVCSAATAPSMSARAARGRMPSSRKGSGSFSRAMRRTSRRERRSRTISAIWRWTGYPCGALQALTHGECRHVQQFVGRRPSMDLCQEHSRGATRRRISLMHQPHLVAGQDARDHLDRPRVSFGCGGPPLARGCIQPGIGSAQLKGLLKRP